MASINKTARGNYRVHVYMGKDEGKQVYETFTTDTLREAKIRAAELEEQKRSRQSVKSGKVSAYMRRWLEMKKSEVAPSTYLSYKLYVEKHFIPYFRFHKLHGVSEYDIKKYFASKELSNTTLRKHFFMMRSIFNDALKGRSPFVGLKPPERNPYQAEVVTEAAFIIISNLVKDTEDELPILLGGLCGLRLGEIAALTRSDFNFANKTVTISKAMALSENGYIIKDPKSRTGIRTIDVSDRILKLVKTRGAGRLLGMRPDSYSSRFAKLMHKLGMPYRFHDLRHYHASVLYKNGVPDMVAAKRLGHDIAVLKDVYQHLHEDFEEKYSKIIHDIMS